MGSVVRRLAALAVLTAMVVGACASGGGTFASFAARPLVGWGADDAQVDLGFRPSPDALDFPNSPDTDRAFTVADLIALFGPEGVCESPTGECVVRPQAQQWAEQVSAAVPGGVCEGMAVFSLDRFAAEERPPAGDLEKSSDLDRRVVRLFATQFLPQVVDQAASNRGRSLAKVVEDLEERLDGGEPATMGLYVPGAGHAVVPYAVERADDGRAVVWVYDPNWPGQDRFVEFDLGADRWRFSFAGEDPANDDEAWFGGPSTVDLVGLTAREAPFREPFTGAGAGRPLLAVTTAGRTWSVQRESDVLADQGAVPGSAVETVGRGAWGTSTVISRIPAAEPVLVRSDGRTRLTVTTPAGSVAITLPDDGGSVEVVADDNGITVRALSTPAQVQVAATGGWIAVDGGTGAEATLTDEDDDQSLLSVVPTTGAPTVELELSGGRRDLAISRTGVVTARATPSWPASVRTGADPRQPADTTLPPAPTLPVATIPPTTTTEPVEDPDGEDGSTTTVPRTTTTRPGSTSTTRPPSSTTTTTQSATTTTKPKPNPSSTIPR
jgi:hypothetical protein